MTPEEANAPAATEASARPTTECRNPNRLGGRSPLAAWRDALRDSTLDRTAKLVGHTLATYANASGVAFPSRKTLAAGASLGKGLRSVEQAIVRLEEAGFLSMRRSRGKSSHTYTLTIPTTQEVRGSTADSTAQPMRRSKEPTTQKVRGSTAQEIAPTAHDATANGAGRAPESSSESEEGSSSGEPAENFAELVAGIELRGPGRSVVFDAWRAEPERVAACVSEWRNRRGVSAGLLIKMVRDGDRPKTPARPGTRRPGYKQAKTWVDNVGAHYADTPEALGAELDQFDLTDPQRDELIGRAGAFAAMTGYNRA